MLTKAEVRQLAVEIVSRMELGHDFNVATIKLLAKRTEQVIIGFLEANTEVQVS